MHLLCGPVDVSALAARLPATPVSASASSELEARVLRIAVEMNRLAVGGLQVRREIDLPPLDAVVLGEGFGQRQPVYAPHFNIQKGGVIILRLGVSKKRVRYGGNIADPAAGGRRAARF